MSDVIINFRVRFDPDSYKLAYLEMLATVLLSCVSMLINHDLSAFCCFHQVL